MQDDLPNRVFLDHIKSTIQDNDILVIFYQENCSTTMITYTYECKLAAKVVTILIH